MLGRKIIKRQQDIPVFGQTLAGLGILGFIVQQEVVKGLVCAGFRGYDGFET